MPARVDNVSAFADPPGRPGTAAGTAGPGPRRLTRMPSGRSLLGVRAGQLVAWQLTAIVAAGALAERGHMRWALGAVALLGCCLTVPKWRHRWAYEWLLTAASFLRAQRALPAAPASAPGGSVPAGLPHIDIIPARIRGGDAGVIHDGAGFAVVVALAPQPGGAPVTELPVARLASLLDPDDELVSAIQVILHADLTDGDARSGPGAAYRSLGYCRMPRSASAWIALRHDPAVSRYAVVASGATPDVHASLVRGLATRGTRMADLIGDLRLRGQLLDARAARELVTATLLTGEAGSPRITVARPAVAGLAATDLPADDLPADDPAAAGPARPHKWRSWHSGTRQHITYWLRRWPAGGLDTLQEALAAVPALAVTTGVVIARIGDGRIGLSATIRVTTTRGPGVPAVARAAAAAAASCGARLVRMDGEHADGVLATLPLGRGPVGRCLGWHTDGQDERSLTAVLSMAAGGVVLGARDDGGLVAIPCFTADRATRVTVIGDALLPRLLALRAIGTGARLQVVTSQPAGWLKLRDHAQVPPERMPVVRPGTQVPADGTRADPWMIIDDTGSPESAGSYPWQSVVTVLAQPFEPGALLPGQDAIVLQRTSAAGAAAVVTALSLTAPTAQHLEAIPEGIVAMATPEPAVRYARLDPDPAEREMLTGSPRTG
jgi:type VII secretion protein EccE